MATEVKKIIVRKGLSAQLPNLDEGEPGFTTDTQKLYVGTSTTTNIELSKEGHTHTLSNITNAGTIASINLNNNANEFLKGDGSFGIPAGTLSEWSYIGASTLSQNGIITIDSSVISGAFDLANYDYKVVVAVETNDEDNSEVDIRINNLNSEVYRSLYTRVNSEDNTTSVFSFPGPNTLISTGVVLPAGNTGVAYTHVQLEFTLFRTFNFFDIFGSQQYNYVVRGEGSATSIAGPVSNTLYPLLSTFIGSLSTSEAITSLQITHEITSGTVDTANVRVYRRAK